MKFRIYIDETGSSDIESSDNPNHRFLSLTGVILDLDYVEKVVHPQMEQIKASFFRSHPDDPVIFHRTEMMNAKTPFEALRDSHTRERFDEQLLGLLTSWQYTVITVCLDKKKHKETYATWRYDPYHYCLALLMERFVYFLNRSQSKGDVMAESRGGKADLRLKASFHGLWENGTEYVEPDQFKVALTSCQLKVKPKASNVAGLQLADLLAHTSRNEILEENAFIHRTPTLFAQKVRRILTMKYDQQAGRVFGKKLL